VTTPSLTGQSILHYNIRDRLGAGGTGEVYVADTHNQRIRVIYR